MGLDIKHMVEEDPRGPFREVTPSLRVMGGRGLRLPPWAEGFKSISSSVTHARPPQKWGENQSLFPTPRLRDLSIRPFDCKGDIFIAGKAAACSVYALTFWDGQALSFAAAGILLKRDRANTDHRGLQGPHSPPCCSRARTALC